MKKISSINRQTVIIAVLGIVIICLAYFKFVYLDVNSQISSLSQQQQELSVENEAMNKQIENIKNMQDELNDLQKNSYMNSYNNVKQELSFLNRILKNTESYSLNFEEVTREGNLIRRPFNVTFATSSYDKAETFLKELQNANNRIIINDVNMGVTSNYDNEYISVTINATFYETLVDGEADAALPSETTDENTEDVTE